MQGSIKESKKWESSDHQMLLCRNVLRVAIGSALPHLFLTYTSFIQECHSLGLDHIAEQQKAIGLWFWWPARLSAMFLWAPTSKPQLYYKSDSKHNDCHLACLEKHQSWLPIHISHITCRAPWPCYFSLGVVMS